MALIEIDRNDVIATKEGRTYRVLSVHKDGGRVIRVDGIDDTEPTPMRRPIFAAEISRVVKKALKSDGLKAQEAMPAGGDVGVKIPPVYEKPADDKSFETKKEGK